MERPLLGILLKCLSVTLFTVMAALAKATSEGGMGVPPGEQVFFRSFFAIPVILVWLALRGDFPSGLHTARPFSHAARGIAGSVAMGFLFLSLSLLPLPEATALTYAMPLMVVIFAALLLGEKVRLFRLSMVGLGLAGVLIVLLPQIGVGSGDGPDTRRVLGVAAALTGACCAALAQIFIRKMARQEETAAIVFWFSVTATVLSLATLPFGWVLPDARTAAMLVLMGVIGGFGQIFLTTAYRFGEASLIAPFEYVSMLMSIAIGWAFFGEIATPATLLGASVVILAGILIIWRERQLGLERSRQRQAQTPQG